MVWEAFVAIWRASFSYREVKRRVSWECRRVRVYWSVWRRVSVTWVVVRRLRRRRRKVSVWVEVRERKCLRLTRALDGMMGVLVIPVCWCEMDVKVF